MPKGWGIKKGSEKSNPLKNRFRVLALIYSRPEGLPPVPHPLFQYKILGIDLLSPRRTTIGAGVLNFRVRNGNGCYHSARDTENTILEFVKG